MMEYDQQLHAAGYWRFTPAGMAVPGLFDAISWSARDCRRFWQSHQARFAQLPLPAQAPYLFAYEAEHRRMPIITMVDAYDALVRISATGYDIGPALQIKAAMEAASTQARRHQVEAIEAKHRAAAGATWRAELAFKQLPSGAAANLALIRAALKMPAPALS